MTSRSPRLPQRLRAVGVALAMSALFAAEAHADTAPANVRHVHVVVAGGEDDASALRTSLHELLARIGADLTLDRVTRAEASAPNVDGAHRDFATVGVDFEAEGETRVVVADARGDVRMHKSVPRGSDRHVAIEQASHVVQGAVEALEEEAAEAERPPRVAGATTPSTATPTMPPATATAPATPATSATPAATSATPKPPDQTTTTATPPTDANAGLQPDATPPHEVAPVARPTGDTPNKGATTAAKTDREVSTSSNGQTANSVFALDVFGAFELAGYGAGSGVVVGGAAGAVLHDIVGTNRRILSLWLLGEIHAPFTPTNGAASADVSTYSFRAMPAIDLVRGASWRFEAGIGGGVDVLHVSPKTAGVDAPPVHLGGARTDVDPIASAMIAAHAAIAPVLDVFAAFRLDADLASSRYETDTSGARSSVFDPWRVRPSLLLGLTWDAVGPPTYTAGAENTEPTR